jgi:hypothetical protein
MRQEECSADEIGRFNGLPGLYSQSLSVSSLGGGSDSDWEVGHGSMRREMRLFIERIIILLGCCRHAWERRQPLSAWRELHLIRRAGLFDAAWYEKSHPDLHGRFVDPLWHYVLWGAREGLNPHPLFDVAWYLKQCPDVAEAAWNPVVHYLQQGARQGLDPHPLFAGAWYLKQYPDVATSGGNPLVHYLRQGGREGRDPHPLFDSGYFMHQVREVEPG